MNNKYSFLNKLYSFIKQILIILLYFFTIVIFMLLFSKDILNNNIIINNIIYFLIYLIVLTLFIIIFRKKVIPDFYNFKKEYIKDNFKYYIIGLLIMIISNIIISYFTIIPKNETANREIFYNYTFFAITNMIILAPITEELMTRIILKDTFKNSYIYAIISGLIFGYLHVIGTTSLELLYLIPYSALGFSLALIYSKTNNIWSNIFFHSLHNFICIFILLLGGII